MSMVTNVALTQESIALLQDLIEINIDSRDGFDEVAGKTEDIAIANLFRSISDKRQAQASELQTIVEMNCEKPVSTGSKSAVMHRLLINLRAALGGGTKVMLIEAEKGEDYIKQRYKTAIEQIPDRATADLILRQYRAVAAAHDRVRELRDSYSS